MLVLLGHPFPLRRGLILCFLFPNPLSLLSFKDENFDWASILFTLMISSVVGVVVPNFLHAEPSRLRKNAGISWRLDESAIGWLACEAPTFSSPRCSATYRPNSGCRRTIRCGRSDRSPTRS